MAEPARRLPVGDDADPVSRRDEIDRLRAEIQQVNRTWGRNARFPDEARRLEDAIINRRIAAASLEFRLEEARRNAAELAGRIKALGNEIGGFERGLEALLRKILEEATEWSRPLWSPIPVFGYRLWWITHAGLSGATGFVWYRPHLSARCGGAVGTDDGEVPHTDGRCGKPPCGIYALKNPETILRFGISRSPDVAGHMLGLTALSGKVVEHDGGYRAQHAQVVAVAVTRPNGALVSDDPEWIGRLFRDPIGVATGPQPPSQRGPDARSDIIEFFATCKLKEEQKWTLGNRSG